MPVGTLADIRTQNAAGPQARVLVLNHTQMPHTLAHVYAWSNPDTLVKCVLR